MGSSTILDILSSIIIAGFLLLMVIHMNSSLVYSNYTTTNDLTVQENLVSLVRMIEDDFRRIGYCREYTKVPDPSKAILGAGRHNIKFQTDLLNVGNVDTLEYSIGTISGLTGTPNPRDMYLFRDINNRRGSGISLGVTKFDFVYFDAQGDSLPFPISNPNAIYEIQLSVLLESPYAYDTTYSFAFWRQLRLAARNLKNR
ncbi:MAG: hypothetical protein HZB59_05400 [Ignavibacteriales bacterium]|nr:hypothetical protein [Ignavibacteriales bacterium]